MGLDWPSSVDSESRQVALRAFHGQNPRSSDDPTEIETSIGCESSRLRSLFRIRQRQTENDGVHVQGSI